MFCVLRPDQVEARDLFHIVKRAGLKNTLQAVRPPVAVILRVLFCENTLPQVKAARRFNPREAGKEV
jgi:hypothetical protein